MITNQQIEDFENSEFKFTITYEGGKIVKIELKKFDDLHNLIGSRILTQEEYESYKKLELVDLRKIKVTQIVGDNSHNNISLIRVDSGHPTSASQIIGNNSNGNRQSIG